MKGATQGCFSAPPGFLIPILVHTAELELWVAAALVLDLEDSARIVPLAARETMHLMTDTD